MIEGMIVLIITLFVLVWLIGLCVLFYEFATLSIVTNDTASKIANSYYYDGEKDIVMGFIRSEDFLQKKLYRAKADNETKNNNVEKAEKYVKYKMDKLVFINHLKDIKVNTKLVNDTMFRRHIEVEVTGTFVPPAAAFFERWGMRKEYTYSSVACADCTDTIEYLGAVNLSNFSMALDETAAAKFAESIKKLMDALN